MPEKEMVSNTKLRGNCLHAKIAEPQQVGVPASAASVLIGLLAAIAHYLLCNLAS